MTRRNALLEDSHVHTSPVTKYSPQDTQGLRLLLMAIGAAVMFHGGLLPFTHANTYDAFIHMFFADSYHRSWFDPWEARWYTGFATTSYPPGTHMMQAVLMHVMPLRAAFVAVQLTGLLLLVLGTYRFALIWVQPRAAGYAAIALVLATSISETIHLFGQLPTIFSLGLFLNGLPHVYRWVAHGTWRSLAAALIFAAGTTAAHHVTTIFGGVLFIIPVALHALRSHLHDHPPLPKAGRLYHIRRYVAPVRRGIGLGGLMIVVVAVVVFPYWYWSITDPITQVPIPHGSRESFIDRPDLGLVFFVIPWGLSLLFLPYAFYKGATSALWPLAAALALCFILGTGGTTPIPRAILGGAFDILTLDRFTFWGSILILPFTGLLMDGVLHGRAGHILRSAFSTATHRSAVALWFLAMAFAAAIVAILPTVQPTQPQFVDPAPIVQFLESDEHNRWRYLTLGMGDQFAYLSSRTTALSVDGNYHSARRLPDLTRFSVERLENAKYLGVPGLGSLKQFIVNADRYHLKYIFSNDAFYDPLLHFNGWTRLQRLQNGITVWERPDITPLPRLLPRNPIPASHSALWGTLPPMALILSLGLLFLILARANLRRAPRVEYRPVVTPRDSYANPVRVRCIIIGLGLALITGVVATTVQLTRLHNQPKTAQEVITDYFEHLDFRRFPAAHELQDPNTRTSFEDTLFGWRWQGGLIASFGKLEDIEIKAVQQTDRIADFKVTLHHLTALKYLSEVRHIRTIRRGGHWYILPTKPARTQTPHRLDRQPGTLWHQPGRRQPRPETDLHRDRLDRPDIAVTGARAVLHDGRSHLIGQVTNTDHDPAVISLFGMLDADTRELTRKAMGATGGHRLLPAESAGFRVDFDGVLSLQDAAQRDRFDPSEYLPPEFASPPDAARLEARALVGTKNLYRGVALNNINVTETKTGLRLTALAVNTGTETATITRLSALLYDQNEQPLWADAAFTTQNIYPGQSAPVTLDLPTASAIIPIAPIPESSMMINGARPQSEMLPPLANHGTIALAGKGGYSAARLHVTSMTNDALF